MVVVMTKIYNHSSYLESLVTECLFFFCSSVIELFLNSGRERFKLESEMSQFALHYILNFSEF